MTELARSTNEWQQADLINYLHPFTDYKALLDEKALVITRGKGCYVWDSDNNRYLDGLAGLACVNIGYGRTELGRVAAAQVAELSYFNSFFKSTNPAAIRLAERLVDITPDGLNHVFYANSGSEANDTALRMVRQYWMLEGRPEKQTVIAREMAYHGSTVAAGALSGMPPMHEQAAVVPDIQHIQCPYQFQYGRDMNEEAFGLIASRWLEDRILETGPEKVAAFFAEPVQGAGGAKIPPRNYFKEIGRICRKYDVLLVIDEVITGFGRTGKWFASDLMQIEQVDLMCIAKGITSGYLPLSAVMVGDRVADALIEKGGEFFHGFTYSGHPVSCAVALENLRILDEEEIILEVEGKTGPYLKQRLEALSGSSMVGEVRSCGMIGAVELVRDSKTMEPIADEMEEVEQYTDVFRDLCLEQGIIVRPIGSTIMLCPPLIITEPEIDFLVDKMQIALHGFEKVIPG